MLARGESVLSRVCLAFTRRVRKETALRTAVIAEWSWQRESAYSGFSADGVSPLRQDFPRVSITYQPTLDYHLHEGFRRER